MTDDIIRANPGFWLHCIPGRYGRKFERSCSPIIAWRKTTDGYAPISIDGEIPTQAFDHAIEYPDGTCVNDGGFRYSSSDAWIEEVETDFAEFRKEFPDEFPDEGTL